MFSLPIQAYMSSGFEPFRIDSTTYGMGLESERLTYEPYTYNSQGVNDYGRPPPHRMPNQSNSSAPGDWNLMNSYRGYGADSVRLHN